MKKQHLPTKICAVCGLPFTWRKKWAKVWDEVKYCSERCQRAKNKKKILKHEEYFNLAEVISKSLFINMKNRKNSLKK
ncbi:DUF2256 domain-containing protein [Francisella philomiragia]|nr:DUF2256 domain-containing protein [Francisella philomiragia]